MDIYVLNRNFEILDICDEYESIIWTTRYYTAGDFELYLRATDKYINLLKEDLYLVRNKDVIINDSEVIYKNVMIIEKVQIKTSLEEGNHLIITGRCLKSILSRRIIWNQITLRGRVGEVISKVIDENAINPAITERKIAQLQIQPPNNITETINRQVTGDNLMEFVSEVCTAYGIGWDIYISKGMMNLYFYRGIDRSYNQDENPYIVFSPENDNLLTTDYTYDKSQYKNVALVAGEGEGTARKRFSVGSANGLDRYEIYVDSRDLSTNNGEITNEDYNKMLAEKGNEVLKEDENSITENIEGQVEPLGNYQFEVDYFLGDIVEVVTEHGIETAPRIIEIIESEDESGSSTIPTFSTWEV